VYAATYDPASASLPYPGTALFKSTDYGASWAEVGLALPRTGGTFSGISVGSDSTVYVANESDLRLHSSRDGGTTWVVSPVSVLGEGLVSDPATAGVLYRRRWGVMRSADGGATWVDSGPDLGDPLPGDYGPGVSALAIDPSDPATLYAGRHERGIYRSRDSGATWAPLDLGLVPTAVLSIAVAPADPAVVYVGTAEDGLFKSVDGGEHWAPVATGRVNRQVFAVAVDTAGAVYAGIYDCCVLLSSDGGATWNDAAPALHETFIVTLVPDPTTPGVIYAGTLQ
jgi:photosystem II stability/assembly factor-like uncharacterized protein